MTLIKYYGNFERLWHWTQMMLVVSLCVTGFEIHNSYELLGYEQAVRIHNSAGWAYAILTIFGLFWLITSGEIKQWLPTFNMLTDQVKYYTGGIFRKDAHPVHKSPDNKLNPLQRWVYFGLMLILMPLQILTGLVYMYVHIAKEALGIESVQGVALLHTLIAFLMLTFLAVHLYLITTGKKVGTNLKAMVTGYEDEDEENLQTT